MKREFLKKLGLEDEQIDKIMSEHGNTINTYKSENEALKTDLDGVKEQLQDRDDQLEDLKNKTDDVDSLKETIDSLKETNKTKSEQHQKSLEEAKKNYETKLALTQAKARNDKAVMALIDMDKVSLDDSKPEGEKLIGLKEQLDALKQSDDWMFHDSDGGNDNRNEKDSDKNEDFDYDAGNSQKKGNNGKDVTPEALGKQKAEELFPSKKAE